MFFPPTRSGSRKIFSLLFPVFSFHSIHLILVSLYSFNRIFLCSQTNSTTAQLLVFLKFFFCSQTNSTTAQLLVFLKLFFHCSQTNSTTAQLLVFHNFSYKHFSVNFNTRSFSDHKPSALPYSFWFFKIFFYKILSRTPLGPYLLLTLRVSAS